MSSIARIIEVTSVPTGEAPLWVRQAWVGCELPCASRECGHIPASTQSVLAPKRKGLLPAKEFMALPRQTKSDGFDVFQAVALEVLEIHNKKAAKWWRDHGFPKTVGHENCFRFQLREVRVLSIYPMEELMKSGPAGHCDDMETGTVRRMR